MVGKAEITEGGCHCESVRFSIEGPLDKILLCHCQDCLKTLGNSMPATAVPDDRIMITGDTLRWYKSSEIAERGFCSVCGATMFYRKPGRPIVSIAAGMLDDPTVLEFGGHIYLGSHPGFQPLEENPVDLHDEYVRGGGRRSLEGK